MKQPSQIGKRIRLGLILGSDQSIARTTKANGWEESPRGNFERLVVIRELPRPQEAGTCDAAYFSSGANAGQT